MRNTNSSKGLILLMALLLAPLAGHAQTLNLNYKDTPVVRVLSDLESQTDYSFVYQKQVLDGVPNVTCRLSGVSLTQALDEICGKLGLSYEIVRQSIVIRKADVAQPGFENRVSGKVTDTHGELLVGVTVHNEVSGDYATTGADGGYAIRAAAGDRLAFTCIGMVAQTVPVAGRSVIDIILTNDTEMLEETIVIGYGTAKKISSVVGASSLVKSDAFTKIPAASAGDALQGKVAGLQVFTSSGEPSASVSMRLRGVNSINASNTPLFILDGTPVDVAIFTALNPNDIENVTVLKDASSTAIYGSRAANGVIYITTRKGTGEKPTVTVSGSYGISNMAQFPMELMNAEEWFAFRELADPSLKENAQFQELKRFRLENKIGTDWRKWILNENAPTWKADLSVSGRSERSDYYISLGAFSRQGIEPYSDMDRYSVRSNVNSKIADWLKIGVNLNMAYQTQHNAGYSTVSTGYYNPMNIIAWGLPYTTPYEILTDGDGNFTGYGPEQDYITDLGMWNYFRRMEKSPMDKNTIRINGNLYQELTPVRGLTLRAVQAVEGSDYRYTGKTLPNNYNMSTITEEAFERFYRLTSTNTAEYKFAVAGDHHFVLLAGHESIFSRDTRFSAWTKGQTDERLTDINHGTQADIPSYSDSKIAYNSFFSRLSYDFADKYFLDLTYRIDGSSLFGANRRYAGFWSAGAMWNLSKEDFLKGVGWIGNLQLKASYGTMGNSGISNYRSYGLTSTGKIYDGQTSWYIASLSNPNLTWETLEALNAGLSGRLWNRLNVNIEFYSKNTRNMLMYIPYSYISGFSGGWGNVGSMRNRGIDVELKLDVVSRRDGYLGLGFNMNYNKNVITELYDGRDEFVDGNSGLKFQVGHAYGEFFLVDFAGVDPANGKSLWRNADGSLTGSYSESNAVFLGKNRFAPWSGGASVDASWKGLSFNATLSGVIGKYMENYDRYFVENASFADESNMTRRMMNIWTTPGQITDIPKAGEAIRHDSRFIDNASFVRLKNVQVSYDIPRKLMDKAGFVRGAKIYVSGRNLLTFTKYTGWDPEIDAITAMGNYPNTKQVVFGVEFNF